MSKLDKNSAADNATYSYLYFSHQLTQQFDAAGDVKVADLRYWNPSDPDASTQSGKLYAYNLVHYCLQQAGHYGISWKSSDANESANGITALCAVMTSDQKLVSDISAQLTAIFNFKTPFSG